MIARFEDNSAFNTYIVYYMGVYSGINQQTMVVTLSLSGNGVVNDPFDCYRDISNQILKYVICKGKLSRVGANWKALPL